MNEDEKNLYLMVEQLIEAFTILAAENRELISEIRNDRERKLINELHKANNQMYLSMMDAIRHKNI